MKVLAGSRLGAILLLAVGAVWCGAACDLVLGIESTTESASDTTASSGDSSGAIDGSGGATTNTDSGTWLPTDLDGLALWLEPGGLVLNGDRVSGWRDSSVHGHLAVQSESHRQPQALGETPEGIAFDGDDDFLEIADHPSLQLGVHPFIVEVVFSHTTPVDASYLGSAIIFSKQESDYPYPGIGMFANRSVTTAFTERLGVQLDVLAVAFTPPGRQYNDGQLRLLGMRRLDRLEFELRLNGEPIDRSTVTEEAIDVSARDCTSADGALRAACSVRLGGAAHGGQSLRGAILEVVLARDPSPRDIAMLENYLLRKHAIAD